MTRRSDLAFSAAVKRMQSALGSREAYEKRLSSRDWGDALPVELQDYVAARDTFFLATASADGQPYVQHRGGPPGFVVVRDARTLAFADYSGNRQYISMGNLSENPRVMLILVDFVQRRRLKIWGTAEVREGVVDPDVLRSTAERAGVRAERTVVVHIQAWDLNCPQHITPRYTVAEIGVLMR
ncbi:MAG: pyridoxamine 5'-phosphate oxidase family protein [Myxococcota bacterium]